MQMHDHFFNTLDDTRIMRLQRLLSVYELSRSANNPRLRTEASRALIVLSYAEWEGFYNDCVKTFFTFCENIGILYENISERIVICEMEPLFQSMRDRNHSISSKLEVIEKIEAAKKSTFNDKTKMEIVQSKSNLNFEKLKENFYILDIDISPYQKSRLRIDSELVGWRHSVAHGDSPDLSSMNSQRHVEFTSNLLLQISDSFQYKMINYI